MHKGFIKDNLLQKKVVNHSIIERMNAILEAYFDDEINLKSGLPSVQYLANQLHVSPRYLSDLLRSAGNFNARQHIHEILIQKAKEKLLATNTSVSAITYELGF